MSKNEGTVRRTLDLGSLVRDYQSGKIKLSFPAHYKKKLHQPDSKSEDIEEDLYCFCRHYLDSCWPDKIIAKNYKTTADEVEKERGRWATLLSAYYI